jgi:putative heme transporter
VEADVSIGALPQPPGVRPRTSVARWRTTLLFVTCLAVTAVAAGRASAAGASWTAALGLIGRLPWVQVAGLGIVWILGLYVHAIVLAASLPGLTRFRALTLNLSGSAVSSVLPVGGLAGVALNLSMTRSWGHSRADFGRFVVVSKACDIVARLLMPAVALAALLGSGVLTAASGAVWMIPAGVGFAAGVLLLRALCGRATPLLGLVELMARAGSRVTRRAVGGTWPATVSAFLAEADLLVRRRRTVLALGTAGYWLAQGTLLWCCLLAVGLRTAAVVAFGALIAERLMTLLVVTPGGAGVAEAGMVTVLIALGTDATGSLAGVLLFRSFVFVAGVPIGAVLWASWWAARRMSKR